VLVGAGQEHDVVALHPLEACQCVAGHGGVAVADVQLVAGIINRCVDARFLCTKTSIRAKKTYLCKNYNLYYRIYLYG
jgi:hypothetical protein